MSGPWKKCIMDHLDKVYKRKLKVEFNFFHSINVAAVHLTKVPNHISFGIHDSKKAVYPSLICV